MRDLRAAIAEGRLQGFVDDFYRKLSEGPD